jgi:hypothetical protein
MGVGINLGQVNFSKGVLAPDLHARVDVTSYNAGLKRGENIVVLKRGGFQNRQGTFFVRELPGPGRLFPFEYSIDQTYALAFTQGLMESLAYGGAVLEADTKITAITNANPAVVTMPFHGYSDDDEVYFTGISGMVELNDRMLAVTVIDDDTFSVPVDSTDWGVFSDSTGTLNAAPPPPSPPPPPVPPPSPPPPPPDTGGGGGTGTGTVGCPAEDELWLMANDDGTGPGYEIEGKHVLVGDMVWTQHEATGEWGAYPVEWLQWVKAPVMRAENLPQALPDLPARPMRATADHPMRKPGEPWFRMEDVGVPDGGAWVIRAKIKDAHTMVVNGVLCHNKRKEPI